MVKGYQGEDLKEEGSIAACVKHFAGYGAPDAGRDYNTVELSSHSLREFYLPAYEAGIGRMRMSRRKRKLSFVGNTAPWQERRQENLLYF